MTALTALAAALAADVVLAAVALIGARRREDAIVRHVDAHMAGVDAETAARLRDVLAVITPSPYDWQTEKPS